MKISEAGINLIKNFEGCRLKAYKPVAGETYWTIGWGHYGPDVTEGMRITQERADKMFLEDMVVYENHVMNYCKHLKLNQNQFDALVSFTYNCGAGNLQRLIRNRTIAQIADHIEAYNKGAGGVTLAGLVRRRKAEKELFLKPIDPNEELLEYLGISMFHRAGFKGDGVVIASREGTNTLHGKQVYEVLRTVCPEADIRLQVDYTDAEGIDIYTTSEFFASDKLEGKRKAAKELYDSGTFLCCAIGNEGTSSTTNLSKDEWWTSVGACELKNGELSLTNYSSSGDNLDFMSLTNFVTTEGKFSGTSCASPMLAGMLALVQDYFLERTGKKLSNNMLLKFIKDNSYDIGEEGKDIRTGYGIFRLPGAIDVSLYEEEEEMRYNKIEEVPDYAKDTIRKLAQSGFLKGTDEGFNLSEDMIRMFVIMDRAGLFK